MACARWGQTALRQYQQFPPLDGCMHQACNCMACGLEGTDQTSMAAHPGPASLTIDSHQEHIPELLRDLLVVRPNAPNPLFVGVCGQSRATT